MTQSCIGTDKFDLDTPILCIDLDVMESNIRKMAGFIHDRGKQWRPHEKCHKTPAIALKQIAAGAIGVTCAKVSEAEVMASAGVRDILVANMIVGKQKWERVASLCRHADPPGIDTFFRIDSHQSPAHTTARRAAESLENRVGPRRVGRIPRGTSNSGIRGKQ